MRINIPHITKKRALIATPIVALGVVGGVVFAKPDATVYQTTGASNPSLTDMEQLDEQDNNLPNTQVTGSNETSSSDSPDTTGGGAEGDEPQSPQPGESSTGGGQNDQPEQEPEPAPPAPTPPPVKLVSATARFEEVGVYAYKLRDLPPKGYKYLEQYCDYVYSNGDQVSKFVGFVSRTINGGGSAIGEHGC